MKICPKCGEPKILGGRTRRYYVCPPCTRAYIRKRTGSGEPTVPVKVVGARERLAEYLDRNWNEALPKLAELLDRSAAFGVPLKDRAS